ncbi:hypothetical protein ACVFI8_15575 [Agarivorans sp. MS3-6]|uniref:hypothetical protein n=1 Tax=Agarivorans sp. TSD2052 TaxID=2937286 RepID=UPI00200D36B6|nr:hypothetical protein [Agarivorans sp. TSD2052]UPW17719.1 hypothetical protein M0C34_15935 [Agarivorans sp. TSD2052]
MSINTLNGKQFWKVLRKKGIPPSVFAMKANCSLNSVYNLKERSYIPAKFAQVLDSIQ